MLLIATACSTLRSHCNQGLQMHGTTVTTTKYDLLEQVIRKMQPTIVFIDIALPGFQGANSLVEMRLLSPTARIIVLGDHFSEEAELELILAGAHGICSRDIDADQIRTVFMAVTQGEIWIRRSLIPRLLSLLKARVPAPSSLPKGEGVASEHRHRYRLLTPREQEIAELVGDGNSNKQIARKLSIAERTVKAHLSEIFRKLTISDRLVLALRVIAMRERPEAFAPLNIALEPSILQRVQSPA